MIKEKIVRNVVGKVYVFLGVTYNECDFDVGLKDLIDDLTSCYKEAKYKGYYDINLNHTTSYDFDGGSSSNSWELRACRDETSSEKSKRLLDIKKAKEDKKSEKGRKELQEKKELIRLKKKYEN